MEFGNEITVLVNCDYETLNKKLLSLGFTIKDKFQMNDIYMVSSSIDIYNTSNLEILKKYVLIREIVNVKKELLYKYKKYSNNGDIIEQAKVQCPIVDIYKAFLFMESLDYKEIFRIYSKCIVYANKETEMIVQFVNDEYLLLEMECKDKEHKDIQKLKKRLEKYDLDYDNDNYFVKKAELMLDKIKNKSF